MLDVSIWGAFIAGLLSFLTPCVLPIVPFYLAYLAGSTAGELKGDDDSARRARLRAITNSIAFVLGLVTIFTLLGLSSSFLGQFLQANIKYFRWLAGGILIVLGLHFIGVFKIGFLQQEARLDGPKAVGGFLSAFVVGMVFAFGWTACVGPILAAILLIAAQSDSVFAGARLLFVYGLGLGLPFIFAAVFYGYFIAWYGGFRKHLHAVEIVVGVFMIVFGILLITNAVNYIAQWMLETFPFFQQLL